MTDLTALELLSAGSLVFIGVGLVVSVVIRVAHWRDCLRRHPR